MACIHLAADSGQLRNVVNTTVSKYTGSIKGEKFLDQLGVPQASQQEIWFTEFVR